MRRRLKRFMSLFFVALLMIPPGLIPAVAKAETNEGDGLEIVYHETFEDGVGVAKQSGNANVGVIDKDFDGNENGKALYISNRNVDHDAADFDFADVGLEDGKTYTATVIGYVDSNVIVPSGAQVVLSMVDSYTWLSNVELKTGQVFTLTKEFTVNTEKDSKLRVQSNEDGDTVPFYIGDILITTEETEVPETPFEPDLIYEADFEDGTAGWSPRGDGVNVSVKDDGSGENNALLVTGRSDGWHGTSLDVTDRLESGAEYEMKVSVKRVNAEEASVIKTTVAETPENYANVSPETTISDTEWTELTGTYTLSDGVSSALFYVESSNAEEEFYIDNVSIIQTSPAQDVDDKDREEIPEDQRIAIFTDFEDGTAQGWAARGENEKLTVVDGTAKNGDHSLLVENRKASSDAAMIEFLDKMNPGYEYEFSLWVKLADGEEATELQLSAAETVNGETSYYPPVIEPTIVTSDEWVLLEGTYDVPSAIEELFFYVEEKYDEDSDSGVSYYIDDFKAEVFVPESSIQDLTPLKDIYKDYFYIGNAVESVHFSGRTLELLTKHHNLVTAENIMKPENYYSNGEFDSSGPDRFLRNAVDNGLEIHGHVLLWHSQSEDSLYQNADGTYKSSEEALANMHEHIEKVMRSAHAVAEDSIISWDVVNEALDGNWSNPEDWESILRPASGWLQAIGPDYMYEAFLKARQVADDLGQYDMILYYNDYNDHVQPKAQTMYHMVKDINERYAEQYPDDSRKLISGVGMQAHYTTSVNVENVRASLERFISLGVEVGVTELDVGASEGTTLTEEEELQQAYFYAQLFSLYKEHSDHMSRVTLWGLSDGNSWRSENNPLLFDRNLQAKLAYHALVDPDKFIEENGPDEVVARAGNAAYGSPTIDGKIDELWSDAPVLPINRFQTAHNGATGEARVLWDTENLYVLVEVNDNELDKTGTDAHEQDSVEVFIDEQNTKAASYGEGHGQYRVNFDNEQSFNPGDISEGFESSTVVNGTNYLVEMKIPFKTTEVEDGNTIGFDVQINDAVNGNRNSVAIWNDTSGMGWSDPSVFGNLTLAKSTIDPDPKPDPKPDPSPKPETSVIVKPVVVDKQAKVADKDVEKVVKDGELIVDVSDNDSSIKVSFTKEQIKTLKEQNATIIVKKKDVEVQIPASILTNGNEAVEIEIEKMKDIEGALSAIYDFRILQGGTEIKEFDSHVTLTFEVDQDKVENPENVKVFYWNPDTEEWELVGGTYADGYISVDVDHFSIFAVFETEPGEVPVTEVPKIEDELETEVPEIVEEPETVIPEIEDGQKLPKTATNTFNWLMIGFAMLVLGASFIFITKRKRA